MTVYNIGNLLSYDIHGWATRQVAHPVFNETQIYVMPNSFKTTRMITMTSKT